MSIRARSIDRCDFGAGRLAKLMPHRAGKTADPEWAAAYELMMARLDEGASLGGLKITRDELHDRYPFAVDAASRLESLLEP